MVDGTYFGVIYGYENSTAQAYAEKYEYKFRAIGPDMLGDTNKDGIINASDASNILSMYAKLSTSSDREVSWLEWQTHDANRDNIIDAVDASIILSYYARSSTENEKISLAEFINSN